MYTISKLTDDDIGICVNYIVDEYKSITGGTSVGLSRYMSKVIYNSTGYKIEDSKGTIVAFYAYEIEERTNTAMLTTMFVARGFRISYPMFLLVSHMINVLGGYDNIIYLPMAKGMKIPSTICVDGVINREEYYKYLDKFKHRWG